MTSLQPLPIHIIGGGIAGLTAAVYLRKHGHEVTILEQSSLAHEIGAAFNITPNASHCLWQIGIDPHDGGAVDADGNVFRDMHDGHVIKDQPRPSVYDDLPKGEGWVYAHRYHLHKQLKDRALEEGVKLLTSKHVDKVDKESSQIFCQDGTTYQAEVIIGADGVHSKVRDAIYPEVQPAPSPHAAFRFLLDREKIENHDHDFHYILQPGKTCYWGKPDRMFLVYPTTRDTQLNFVCLFPIDILGLDPKHDNQYSQKATTEQLRLVFKDFEPHVHELIDMVDQEQLRYWPLMDMPDVPSYIGPNIALLGDAAHPYLPYAFQGAGIAIEDGASLGELIGGVSDTEVLAKRLELYEKLRHARCSDEQQFSRDMFKDHSQDPHWDQNEKFRDIYQYRVLDEVEKLKKQVLHS